MTKDVSRRNFVALAGATAAVAACSKAEDKVQITNEPKINMQTLDAFLDEKGLGLNGKNPHFDPTKPENPKPEEFKPPYIVVAHIESRAPWHMKVNHAHYKTNLADLDNTPEKRLEIALEILKQKIDPEKETSTKKRPKRFKNITNPSVFDKGSSDYADYDGMKKIGFNSKHELFVFFESRQIALTSNRLIYFSKTRRDGVTVAEDNDSFFNARIVGDNEVNNASSVKKLGKIIRIENHCIYEDGKTRVGQTEAVYSMNFVYMAPDGETGEYIPMIIDPDTGNGLGNTP
jgi:hypothetical protein